MKDSERGEEMCGVISGITLQAGERIRDEKTTEERTTGRLEHVKTERE